METFISGSTTFLTNKKARFPSESSLHVRGSTPTSGTELHADAGRRDRHPATKRILCTDSL